MADTATIGRCPNCALHLLRPKDVVEPRTARVEELLRQNHPPLDVELSAFRTVAEDTRNVLEDLDYRIVQTRELLENLLSARQQAQSRLADATSILHPMRSIPDELLAEIFGHCILKEYDEEAPDSLDPRAAPWLLTRVSRRWRELAVNSPHLWTFLLLDFDKHIGDISNHQCAYKVCLFTERSRGLPLTVYLGSEDSLKRHPVLPVLEASIPRWRHLEVDLPRSSLQLLSRNNFLKLHTLVMNHNAKSQWHLNLDVFKSSSAPVLRTLEVAQHCPWRAWEHITFSWSQLTSMMDFPAFDANGWIYLHTMTDLEELSVVATSAHAPIHDVVSLLKLRRLNITESHDALGRSQEFFSALTIPALSELTLEYHEKSVLHFPVSPLPLGNLIKLDITCEMNSHVENTQHILNFLTLTHQVECLRLYDLNVTLEFVDGLTLTGGSTVRLPCLRFLDIGECEFAPSLTEDLHPLFKMLFSRLPTVMVEGRKCAVQTIKANASCNAGGEEIGTELAPRSRSNSDDHRRCLKTARLPRWLYVDMRAKWPEIFLELASRAELECGVTMEDIDS